MPTHLTPTEMKQFVRDHFEQFVNQRNAAVIRTNMTPDFYDHDGPGGKPTGVDGDEQMMVAMYKVMPDLRISIDDMVAEADKVVCRNFWRWTDPVSQQRMEFHGFVEWRFEGGKIAERWATVTPPAPVRTLKVALFGATGRAGSRILHELLSRGHQVLAVTRDSASIQPADKLSTAKDDLSDPAKTAAIIQGSDAVISAYAPPPENTDELVAVTRRLIEALQKSGVSRLLTVGGAGGLEVKPGVTLIASGYLPPEWLSIAQSHDKALDVLRSCPLDWTCLSPAAYFDPGTRTGSFRLGADNLVSNAQGESRISMEDYAIAMVDELEHPVHVRRRFSIGYV